MLGFFDVEPETSFDATNAEAELATFEDMADAYGQEFSPFVEDDADD